MAKKVPQHFHHHTDRRLIFRLYAYYFIAMAMIGLVSFDVITEQVQIWAALLSVALGFGVGLITVRTSHITYDKDLKKVISRMDLFGIVIVVVYSSFSLVRHEVVAYFVHGPAVGAVSFAIIAGVMIGRVFGIRRKIQRVLRDEKIRIN